MPLEKESTGPRHKGLAPHGLAVLSILFRNVPIPLSRNPSKPEFPWLQSCGQIRYRVPDLPPCSFLNNQFGTVSPPLQPCRFLAFGTGTSGGREDSQRRDGGDNNRFRRGWLPLLFANPESF